MRYKTYFNSVAFFRVMIFGYRCILFNAFNAFKVRMDYQNTRPSPENQGQQCRSPFCVTKRCINFSYLQMGFLSFFPPTAPCGTIISHKNILIGNSVLVCCLFRLATLPFCCCCWSALTALQQTISLFRWYGFPLPPSLPELVLELLIEIADD